ncbi:MAG: hypothetical protein Q9182_007453 [Xanthomendoza sp. 2 TL-2023]
MAQSKVSAKKQQGGEVFKVPWRKAYLLTTSDVELQQQYTNYKNSLQQLADRIGNIEQETEEHKVPCIVNYGLTAFLFRLVLETLKPLPEERKCFRMINGVLVERTVKDVMPALQINSDGLKKVLEELVKQYKRQQEEMEKWKAECCDNVEPFDACLPKDDSSVPGMKFSGHAGREARRHVSKLWKDPSAAANSRGCI